MLLLTVKATVRGILTLFYYCSSEFLPEGHSLSWLMPRIGGVKPPFIAPSVVDACIIVLKPSRSTYTASLPAFQARRTAVALAIAAVSMISTGRTTAQLSTTLMATTCTWPRSTSSGSCTI